jgi:hypothetical protein
MEMEQAAVALSGMMPGACSVTVQITAFMLRGPSTREVVTNQGRYYEETCFRNRRAGARLRGHRSGTRGFRHREVQ